MTWTQPIFDRTEVDVIYAKNNQGDTASLKGALDYNGLNRIENNILSIANLFNSNGYEVSIISKTDWNQYDITSVIEFNRIQNNINILQIALLENQAFLLNDVTFTTKINYVIINNIEELINTTKEQFDGMMDGIQRLSFKLGTKKL